MPLLPRQHETDLKQGDSIWTKMANNWNGIQGSVKNHMMDAVFSALREAGY